MSGSTNSFGSGTQPVGEAGSSSGVGVGQERVNNNNFSLRSALRLVINYESHFASTNIMLFEPEFDLSRLFCLILAAKVFDNRRLMDFACLTLVGKVSLETCGADFWRRTFIWEFNSEAWNWSLGSDCGISRPRLICESDFVDARRDCFVQADLLMGRRISVFDDYICKFMGTNDHLEMTKSIKKMEFLIRGDRSLAYRLPTDFLRRLSAGIQIVCEISFQCAGISVLSYVPFTKEVAVKVVPVLVKFLAGKDVDVANAAVIALGRLASGKVYLKYIIDLDAIEVAHSVVSNRPGAEELRGNIVKFLGFICKNCDSLPPSRLVSAFKLSKLLLEMDFDPCGGHKVRLLYALSCLSSSNSLKFEKRTCAQLVKLITDVDNSVAGTALGVIGNIVRCRDLNQIQILVTHCDLLPILGKEVLERGLKKFTIEACHLICLIAAQSRTLIKVRYCKEDLVEPLCRLILRDEYDIKVVAACAICSVLQGSIFFDQMGKDYAPKSKWKWIGE